MWKHKYSCEDKNIFLAKIKTQMPFMAHKWILNNIKVLGITLQGLDFQHFFEESGHYNKFRTYVDHSNFLRLLSERWRPLCCKLLIVPHPCSYGPWKLMCQYQLPVKLASAIWKLFWNRFFGDPRDEKLIAILIS